MRDNLNLKQLAKEANRQRLWARFTTLIGFSVVILSVFAVVTNSTSAQMYVRIGDKWQPIKDHAGGVCAVQTSPNGTTWLLTGNPLALSRWTGDEWEWYTPIEGEKTSDLCRMTLDKETIWVIFDRGIAHFDGQRWKIYTDVTPAKPVWITTNSLGVYVIDSQGNLARFDGNEWSTINVRSILPSLRSNENDNYPFLGAASASDLLVRWNGVWHFDGVHWQEITIGGRHLTPFVGIGTAHNRLWTIWYGEGTLISSQLEGSDSKTYKTNEIGLSNEDQIYQIAEYGNDTLFATDKGLFRFDGNNWTPLSILDNQAISVSQVSVHPNGNIWIITGNSGSVISWVISFLCLTIALIAFFVAIIVNSSRNSTRLRAARSLLEPLVLPVSNSQEVRNTNGTLVAIVIVIIIMVGLAFAGQTELVDISTLILFVLFCIWIARRRLHYSDKDQKPLAKSMPIIPFIGWMGILWFGMHWIETINASLVSPFFIVWGAIGFVPCVFGIIRYIRRYTGDKAYTNATNDNTKSNVSGARKVGLQLIQASTALQAGHIKEAEALARTSVAQSQYLSSAILSAGLNVLGLALAYQEHYEEAVQFIEISIRINPISLSTLTSLAEVYLEAGGEDERAFEVIKFARYYGFENWLVHVMRKSSRPVTEGVYAWALARLGEFEKADKHIQNAMKTVLQKNKAAVAYMYFIKGKIEAIKGNPTKAIEWMTRASQIDNGLYGQMAATALKELPASS